MFSSKILIVSGLIFRSLIHFEYIFVYGVRKCSNFVLLHVAVQFFPAPFIEEAVFAPLNILASFVTNKVPISAWVCFWAFYLVPLVYICFCANTHSSILDWRIPWMEEPGGLHSPWGHKESDTPE